MHQQQQPAATSVEHHHRRAQSHHRHLCRWDSAALPLSRYRLASAIAVCMLAGAIGGCAPDLAQPPAEPPVGGVAVTIIDRGWHTDIALPADALSGPVATLGQAAPGVRFLVFGFGDRDYYMAKDPTSSGGVAAAFPGPGVVLVTALGAPPAAAFGADHVVTLRLSNTQFCAITAFVGSTLQTDGAMRRVGDGPYSGSSFYASSMTYDLFHDCNWWTLAALRTSGLPADPDGVILTGQVLDQARRIAAAQQLVPPAPLAEGPVLCQDRDR
jgi:hypothetical protein